MNSEINKIVKREYYAVKLTLCSPLSISGGENEVTDKDVLRNGKGDVFVPGTSIAGVMRSYLGKSKKEKSIFGFSDGDKGCMSSVFLSDIYFDKAPTIGIRDGVRLGLDKQVEAGGKFDMEIIETGAQGILYMEYIQRERDTEGEAEQEIAQLLHAMNIGEIRLGGNKNRGFGRIKAEYIYEQKFTAEQVEDWIAFCTQVHDLDAYSEEETYEEWSRKYHTLTEQYYSVKVPLKLTGGISIRKYSAQPRKADFEHITCNGESVIPGTSWNGAIRGDVRNILQQLGCNELQCTKLINKWFGYIDTSRRKTEGTRDRKTMDAQQSLVVIGESVIHHTVRVPMTRNKINRFDSSTIESALYTEITACQGETELEIKVKKDDARAYRALLAILELVIQDICRGYVSIGGQAAIGRGIFCGDGAHILDDSLRRQGQQELLNLISRKEG